jgi:hypothetical protein
MTKSIAHDAADDAEVSTRPADDEEEEAEVEQDLPVALPIGQQPIIRGAQPSAQQPSALRSPGSAARIRQRQATGGAQSGRADAGRSTVDVALLFQQAPSRSLAPSEPGTTVRTRLAVRLKPTMVRTSPATWNRPGP